MHGEVALIPELLPTGDLRVLILLTAETVYGMAMLMVLFSILI
jgi:hypothetical protein